jgi:hypothetical protein
MPDVKAALSRVNGSTARARERVAVNERALPRKDFLRISAVQSKANIARDH